MASVDFYYEGSNITVHCDKSERMEQIFQKFINKTNANPNSIIFLYNGTIISNAKLTFNQISNLDDKNRNKMNIIVTNSSKNYSPQFLFTKINNADESMKDFAKMAILLAFQEYPDDGYKRCQLITEKFNERYKGYWICSIKKDGNTYGYFYSLIVIKYGDYKILIGQTKEEK